MNSKIIFRTTNGLEYVHLLVIKLKHPIIGFKCMNNKNKTTKSETKKRSSYERLKITNFDFSHHLLISVSDEDQAKFCIFQTDCDEDIFDEDNLHRTSGFFSRTESGFWS